MASPLSDLLTRQCVLWRVEASSRKRVITQLSDLLAEQTGLGASAILSQVMAREKLGSTGVGEGVAIPHARMDGLEAPIGAFALLSAPVDFEAVDDAPCDLIFMLLAPEANGADHLRALAQVSRIFRQSSTRDALRRTKDADEAFQILCPAKRGAAA